MADTPDSGEDAPERDQRLRWVESNTGHTLSADQERCVLVLCSFAQPYNLHLIGDGWRDVCTRQDQRRDQGEWDDEPPLLHPVDLSWPQSITAHLLGSYATFDFPELTRLVLAGHQHAVRVEISPVVYRYVDTDSHLCDEDGDVTDEHPVHPSACLQVMLTARVPDPGPDDPGRLSTWERHPTIEQVLAARSGRNVEAGS